MKYFNSIFSMLVLILMLVAFFTFLMPFVSVDFWGSSYALTGMDFMTNPKYEYEKLFLISFCATIISAVGSIICYFKDFSLVLPLLSSTIGSGCILLFYSENTSFVSTWFWLFVITHIIAVVLSVCSFLISAKSKRINTSTSKTQEFPDSEHTYSTPVRPSMVDPYAVETRKKAIQKTIGSTSWKCSCGQENAGYVTSCSCGKSKDEALIPSSSWKCLCGQINAAYVTTCGCGKTKNDVKNGK